MYLNQLGKQSVEEIIVNKIEFPFTPHLDKVGYCIKRGQVVHNWKRRYFVLREDKLLYYRNSQVFVSLQYLIHK